MAFIKKNSHTHKTSGITSRWMDFGKPEAEGEKEELREYFEDFLNINDAFEKGKFIITGRKGAGKSAYVQYLLNNSGEENELFCDVVTNEMIDLEKIIQSIPDDIVVNRDETIYEWIILTRFVKLILLNKSGINAEGFSALKKFEINNSGIANVEKWMVIEEHKKSGMTVDVSDLIEKFPTAFSRETLKMKRRAPFYSLIPALREIIRTMLSYEVYSNINFILVFDDLDVNFDLKNTQHKKRLISLLRITRKYNTQIFPNKNARVLNMLRDDIAMQLDGISPDKNKMFSSYEYNLNWYNSDDGPEESSYLRRFINKRIRICFDRLNIKYLKKDPWVSLVENTPCFDYKDKTAFKYILDFTFYRPRDLVAFFNDIGEKKYNIPLQPQSIKTLLKNYLEWNITEIKDELSNLYTENEIERIFNVFNRMAIPNSKITYQNVCDLFKEEDLDENVIEKMLEYNFIIPKDENNYQYFSYRERPRINKNNDYYYSLPKCIYAYYTGTY